MKSIKAAEGTTRYVVVVSATDPDTGAQVSRSHECRDVLHAQHLLTDIGELVEELAPYLPGLTVAGYETGEAFTVTSAGRAALLAENPLLAAVAGWLAG